eukprot:506771-Amorphochlora_amoeboformis.AAC.1
MACCVRRPNGSSNKGRQGRSEFTYSQILVKKALQPGQAPKLVEINLDSNHITNPGYKLLA